MRYLLIIAFVLSCTPKKKIKKLYLPDSHYAQSKNIMISSQGEVSTRAGLEIYKQGGNIIDAFVATSLAISVERPQSTGLGGGGFLLFKKNTNVYVYDFREVAPSAFHSHIYLDEKGNAIKSKSRNGPFAVGVPGLIRGLFYVHNKFGKLKWSQLFSPAIKAAREGIKVYPHLQMAMRERLETLRKYPESAAIFLKNNEPYELGDILKQPQLANTLEILSQRGEKAFYEGEIGQKIINSIQNVGGVMSIDDLKNYKLVKRKALRAKFKEYEIISMPPPSSGGLVIIQILKLLENLDYKTIRERDYLHYLTSAMQLGFYDRAQYMGDPQFFKVPVKKLLSDEYLEKQRKRIQTELKILANTQHLGHPFKESNDTTHLSLTTINGDMIASTQTINGVFGSAMVAAGTGIVLNNEMDDFSAKVGAKNLYGLVGNEANKVEAGKRPLSSMSPTIVMKNGRGFMTLGTPNGPRIITCVAQTLLNRMGFDMPLKQSVLRRRIHHQWLPDKILLEPDMFDEQMINSLKKRGHRVEQKQMHCRVQAIERQNGKLIGVSDPRGVGLSLGL